MQLLEVQHLKKVYQSRGGVGYEALSDVHFSVKKGEFIAIMGESGSGKTTLLNILATLDRPTEGAVYLEGKNLNEIPEKEIAAFRRDNLGFVFQDFNLLDTFHNQDNIFLPLVLSGYKYPEMKQRIDHLAPMLGISNLLKKYPYEVSGGQRQRVAVARALITNANLLLADEPTGALDSKSSEQLMELFKTIHEQGQTILMVTHSTKAAAYASRVLFIRDGRVFHELYKGENTLSQFMEKISEVLILVNQGGE